MAALQGFGTEPQPKLNFRIVAEKVDIIVMAEYISHHASTILVLGPHVYIQIWIRPLTKKVINSNCSEVLIENWGY